MPIRVLLADDHPLIMAGLRRNLSGSKFEVVGELTESVEIIDQTKTLRPDVLVLDYTMPGMDPCELTRQLATEAPKTRVLILTQWHRDDYAIRAYRAGAHGYVLKSERASVVMGAIETVAEGELFFSEELSSDLVERIEADDAQTPDQLLSRQERIAVQLLGRGCTNQEIASKMTVKASTVSTYLARAREKIGVQTASELVVWWVENRDDFPDDDLIDL